jgi:hypothetical protein
MITYKKALNIKNFHEGIKSIPDVADYAPVIQLGKLVKKLQAIFEQINEDIDDLRIEHCNKENNKITRDAQGNYEFTAEGERAFKKAYKELLNKEFAFEFTPLNYVDLCQVLPSDFAKQNPWDIVEEVLEPFYFNEYT